MAELETGKPVSLQELMVTTLAMADAVTKLLIVVALQSLTPQIAFYFSAA